MFMQYFTYHSLRIAGVDYTKRIIRIGEKQTTEEH